MEKISNKFLKESFYHCFLNNGLEVFLYPKKKVKTTYASLHVKFGSIDEHIKVDGLELSVVKGAAHFLEHMCFSLSDGSQVSDYFEQYGADVNAYTSYQETNYYFNTTSHLYDCLNLLFKFVIHSEFKEVDVESERSIILSEYNDGLDNFDSLCRYEMFQSLYVNNPVHNRIIGTKEDITSVTYEQLFKYHDLFYQPSNMFLVIAGDFDVNQMEVFLNNNQLLVSEHHFNLERINVVEPIKVNRDYYEFKGKTYDNRAILSFKIDFSKLNPCEIELYARIIEFILDYYFTSSSSYYQGKYYQGIYNDSFYYAFNLTNRYSYVVFNCSTSKIDEFKKSITDILFNINIDDFSKEAFDHFKRYHLGVLIKMLNSHYDFAQHLEEEILDGRKGFEFFEVLSTISKDDIKKIVGLFTEDNMAFLIGKPDNVD